MILVSRNSPNFKKRTRVKLTVHADGVGLYSFKYAMAFGDASRNVSEVNCSRFYFVLSQSQLLTQKTITIMKQTLLSFLLVLLPIVASADVVEIDGIYYNLITKAKGA